MTAVDVRQQVLDLMATKAEPWYIYDLYKAVGCKWFDILVAMTSLEKQGKVTSRRIATGNMNHPVRRGWELVKAEWMCPWCRDIYGPDDEDKPPVCDMCKKAGRT